jgi:23S rRNA (guanine745-N1)-methyltransferase
MLDARDDFLGRGWYTELRDALSALVAAEPARRVVDIGCGTGYYLRGALAALTARRLDAGDAVLTQPRALAIDLSAPAVARTVRAGVADDGSTSGLVADVWSPLPVRTGVADVILNVFAPRNPAEFHRISAPGGLLAVVVPHPTHLQELRAAGLALDVHENKSADLIATLSGLFELEQTLELSAVLSLSPADVTALIGMGPSAHHRAVDPVGLDTISRVTVAFRILAFRRTT